MDIITVIITIASARDAITVVMISKVGTEGNPELGVATSFSSVDRPEISFSLVPLLVPDDVTGSTQLVVAVIDAASVIVKEKLVS